jgi:hypothetical protein
MGLVVHMSGDIVERLRHCADWQDPWALNIEASFEIERLHGAVERLAGALQAAGVPPHLVDRIRNGDDRPTD